MEKTALQLEEETTYKRYEELREAVREEERSVIIPELKAKYESKYFKGKLHHTLIFSHVKTVNHTQKFVASVFHLPESEHYKWMFEYKFGITEVADYVLQEEITKEDYYTAYRQLDDSLKQLNSGLL